MNLNGLVLRNMAYVSNAQIYPNNRETNQNPKEEDALKQWHLPLVAANHVDFGSEGGGVD